MMICQTEPLEYSTLNEPREIWITWTEGGLPAYRTGFDFTYKPDPIIQGINPNITILR